MEVNLRKAAQIRTAIETALKEIDFSTSKRFPVALEASDRVHKARETFVENTKLANCLEQALLLIRQEIGHKNTTSAISDLLAEKKMWERRRDRLAKVADADVYDPQLIAAKRKSIETQLGSERHYGVSDEISVDFLAEADVTEAKASLLAVKRAVTDLEDRIQALNYQTKITLSGTTLITLQDTQIL